MPVSAILPSDAPRRRRAFYGAGMFGVVAVGLLVGMDAGAPAPPVLGSTVGAPPLAVATASIVESVERRADERGRADVPADANEEVRWFDGRPVVPVRTLTMRVTAYSPDERSCAPFADGITASGYSVWTNGMALVAADTDVLPFGTLITVPGYAGDTVVPVLDRGARIRGRRLDVLYPTHEAARVWGVQELEVTVWSYADGRPSGFKLGW